MSSFTSNLFFGNIDHLSVLRPCTKIFLVCDAMVLAVELSYHMFQNILLLSNLRVSIKKRSCCCQIPFIHPLKFSDVFVVHFVNVVCLVHGFAYVESSFHS